jgi:hypothetical protein
LLRQGFLQQRTGNIRHNQSLPEFGDETAATISFSGRSAIV